MDSWLIDEFDMLLFKCVEILRLNTYPPPPEEHDKEGKSLVLIEEPIPVCSLIQLAYSGTRAYTPGASGFAHPIPHDVIP